MEILKNLNKNDKEKLLEQLLRDTGMKKCEECEKILSTEMYDFYECDSCEISFCGDCRIDCANKCIDCKSTFCGDCTEKNMSNENWNFCKKCNDKIEK
jgi:hypothetical protein